MADSPDQFFLFLGDSDREGATSKLKITGIKYKKKRLESKLENWESIFEFLDSPNLAGVLVKLTGVTYGVLALPDYKDAVERLCSSISRVPNIIFTHESVFSESEVPTELSPFEEDEMDDPYWTPYFSPVLSATRDRVHELLQEYSLHLTPYRTNAELTVMTSEFIDQHDKNLIFRLYVPSARMWATEADKLLQLFREYLSKVSGLNIRHDQYRTNQGVVYAIYGQHAFAPERLPQEFDAFSELLDLCVVNPEGAVQILKLRSIDTEVIQDIVVRYSKEGRRLQIDLRQDREKRILAIRHRMEAELADVANTSLDMHAIYQLIESVVPNVQNSSQAVLSPAIVKPNMGNAVVVNINPQIVGTVYGVIAKEIAGDQHFGMQATEILELIRKYGEDRKAELTSALHELEDKNAKPTDRLMGKQKLRGFLFKVAAKGTDVGIAILQKYIEAKLGL